MLVLQFESLLNRSKKETIPKKHTFTHLEATWKVLLEEEERRAAEENARAEEWCDWKKNAQEVVEYARLRVEKIQQMSIHTDTRLCAEATEEQARFEFETAKYTLINAGVFHGEAIAHTKEKKIKPKKQKAQLNKKAKWCKQPIDPAGSCQFGHPIPAVGVAASVRGA